MRITRQQLRKWNCDRIIELVPRCGLSPLDIAGREYMSAQDRLWVLLHEEILPASDLRLLAASWAEWTLLQAGVIDQRCWDAVRIIRLNALDEAWDDERVAARDAALDAALDAETRDTAWLLAAWAAYSAMCASSRCAALLTATFASSVAREIAWMVNCAPWPVSEAQIKDVVRMLEA